MSKKQLCIGLSLAPTWLTGQGWRRTDSQVEQIYHSEFYTDLARQAEAAKLDFLFRPDSLFLDPEVLRHTPGFSSLDPTLLMATLTQQTQRIGLVTTASTTFNQPYQVARQIQSLHWLSHGRAGWNIVTALDGHENFGEVAMPGADQRYDKAQEFTDVVQALWRSYPRDALLVDRATGQYVDTHRIQPIHHQGDFFRVKGPLNTPAADYGRVPFLQAGASSRGRDFAARNADAIFAANPDMESGVELRRDIQRRCQQLGRAPNAVKVLPGLSLFLGRTREEAQDLYRQTHSELSLERRYAYLQEVLGLDLRSWPVDKRVTPAVFPTSAHAVRSRTHSQLLHRLIERDQPTLAELLDRPEASSSAHWLLVGTPDDAVAAIEARFEAGAADGFVALPGGRVESLYLFLDQVIPRLVDRGLFRRDYTGTTFAEHLGLTEAHC